MSVSVSVSVSETVSAPLPSSPASHLDRNQALHQSLPLDRIIDTRRFPIDQPWFQTECRSALDREGVLTLPGLLKPATLVALIKEARQGEPDAFYASSSHNVYLTPPDPDLSAAHVFNRQIVSTKGCICDDQVGKDSSLRHLYDSAVFKDFLCSVLGENALFPYADPLSSINIHYAPAGKELGWHFDNSEFAITLLLQRPNGGGVYEYIRDLRDAERGEMNFDGVEAALNGDITPVALDIDPGTLVLFRGRNALHRVTPTQGDVTRYLVVLAYNSEPGISLSETARQTFYGRIN